MRLKIAVSVVRFRPWAPVPLSHGISGQIIPHHKHLILIRISSISRPSPSQSASPDIAASRGFVGLDVGLALVSAGPRPTTGGINGVVRYSVPHRQGSAGGLQALRRRWALSPCETKRHATLEPGIPVQREAEEALSRRLSVRIPLRGAPA